MNIRNILLEETSMCQSFEYKLLSQRWIKDYERRRIRNDRGLNESWQNSKYNTGDWRADQKVRLSSVGLTVGQSWWKLRRLWKKYKMAQGGYRDDLAYQINRLSVGLDIGRVDLPEVADMPDSEFDFQERRASESEPAEYEEQEQNLSIEEIQQLKRGS